jgi:DNA-binding MarR family transcriptional regulator
MLALEQALREVSGVGVLFSQAAAERLGLNSTDLECLGVIAAAPATAGELAQATGLTTGAITGVIDRLERSGYAIREHDSRDRRKVYVRARPEGLQRAQPIFEPMRRASAEALSRYSDGELALILDFLTRAHAASVKVVSALRKLPTTRRKAPRTM